MGKIVVSQFTSVDGVIEDPGGSESWDRGGWAFDYSRGDDGDKFKLDEVMSSEALLLGRTTYEGFAAAWPSREGEFADKFNSMKKYVVSTTLGDPDWNNTTVIADDIPEQVRKAAEATEGDVLVNGSAQLVALLADHDLVDEYRLMVFPVVLGGGKRLFGDTSQPAPMHLAETRAVGSDGVTINIYKPRSRAEA
jgi:dihydrofolate reductase